MGLDQFKSFAKGYDKVKKSNKEVWIYTRVSSKDQESNKSLKNQVTNAKEYCNDNNLVAVKTFGGTYESANGDFTRKEFKRLIEEIKKEKTKPFAILINTISRFSRTGGGGVGLANELVEKFGVNLIEVSTGKSTETEDGKIEIYKGLLQARQDNLDRLRITIPGMKKFLQEGNWLGKAPKGYDTYGTRVKNYKRHNDIQKIVVNNDGKLLKKAWKWKLQGDKDYEIRKRLSDLGLEISKQALSSIWRNPFYCGVLVHKMLDGEVVHGKWEKLVSQQEFLIVQQILEGNNFGYKQDKSNPNRPLNGFIYCSRCGNKLTGYEVKKKGLHYYKCQHCKGGSINANTSMKSVDKGANNLFAELLANFKLPEELFPVFKEQLKLTFETLTGDSNSEEEALKQRKNNLESELKKLKRRFAMGEIDDREIYNELKTEFEEKIGQINQKIEKLESKISNLEKYINFSMIVSQNINKYWESEDIETKKRVQELVFPEGVSLDMSKRQYLTTKANVIFEINQVISRDYKSSKNKKPTNFVGGSALVAGTVRATMYCNLTISP
jgi:DNA invertase Pin-like site-specific DNA recombinase